MDTNIITNTNGKGKNTDEERLVIITRLALGMTSLKYFPDDPVNGELRAYFVNHGFSLGTWNVEGHGTICGDKQWLKEFKAGLRDMGFSIRSTQNIRYGDLTRQGLDYVSLDFDPVFYTSWLKVNKSYSETQKATNDLLSAAGI